MPASSSSSSLNGSDTAGKDKVQVTDVIYQYENRKLFSDFSSPLKNGEVDWRSADFSSTSPKDLETKAKNDGWKWLTREWVNEGEDSWEYANDWSNEQKHWSHASGPFDFSRRKKWTRMRTKFVDNAELQKLKSQYGDLLTVLDKDVTSSIIYKQVDAMKQQLTSDYSNITQQTQKPNILLLGGSGSGKSSLVNAVFGKSLAEIGEGKPITQQYTKYAGETSPVVVYDSRGIEHGYIQDGFVADTRRFFKKIRSDKDLVKHVHVVWYVIDLTQARFQPFEAQFCTEELKGIPIIFVLNKADAVKNDVRDIMIQTIANFNLPNCIGIYPTVACCKNFDSKECPGCGSTKIRKRLKAGQCTIMCKECNYNVTLEKTMGIEQLSRSTLSVLPELVKGVYVNSQKSTTLGKEIMAKQIILEYAADTTLTKTERAKQKLNEMIVKLCELYDVDSLYELIRKKMVSRFDKFYKEQSASKKFGLFINDFLSKRETHAEVFLLAAGVEICNDIIKFKQSAIAHALQNFEVQVNKEIEKEKEEKTENKVMPMKDNVTAIEDPKKTASYSSIHELDVEDNDDSVVNLERDPEMYIDKLIANIHFDVDSALVDTVFYEIKKAKSAKKYLDLLVFNGEKNYLIPEKRVEVAQEEELHIPLYVYQKAKDPSEVQQESTTQQPTVSPPATTEITPATITTSEN